MAFLGGKDLVSLLVRGKTILNDRDECCYKPSHVKQAAYELCLGNEVYLTDNIDKSKVRLDTNSDIIINPGQFALLLTEEVINVPANLLGFISIKASEKLKGLINVSGFHVDPGFKGKLLFSVYNASPSSIQLTRGKPYFLIWFSELKNSLSDKYIYEKNNNHQHQISIDSKYIEPLINGEMVSPHELSKRLNEANNTIKSVEAAHVLKSDKIFWALTIGITLLITLNISSWANRDNYEKGYSDAVKNMEYKSLFDKISVLTSDSLYLYKIDSLLDLRIKKENVKK